ncbi:MAG TPA: Flp family type IVb pilin [Gemmatimonadaceae bacterium]
MRRLIDAVRRFAGDEEGAAIVEYAILVALIAIVAILVVATLGNKVSEKFSEFEAKWA